jgi:hypothetical protein
MLRDPFRFVVCLLRSAFALVVHYLCPVFASIIDLSGLALDIADLVLGAQRISRSPHAPKYHHRN